MSWDTFKRSFSYYPECGLCLDLSRTGVTDTDLSAYAARFDKAFRQMQELEHGTIANPDEGRMVGHYWLRAAELSPNQEIRREIEATLARVQQFAAAVHNGQIRSQRGDSFKHLLVVGIGGSALGPQFVSGALSGSGDPLDLYFFDNTDPDGMARTLARIPSLARTLCIVISKSGGTKETRNGMLVAQAAFRQLGLDPSKAFVAVTGQGSELDKTAESQSWLARFPMWDWVGGRTSELSAVGLLPAALQGFKVQELLSGARAMDELTRRPSLRDNPAALLSLAWHKIGEGRGSKAMVVLPYSDRLELFSRYLQQLVMESIGKEKDLSGAPVSQGISVYGNKGSTDQHAYVQQLRDGLDNFFAVFIEVLQDFSTPPAAAAAMEVEPGISSGDYLSGFYQGTRRALSDKGRPNLTITIRQVNEFTIGALIALFERAVGLYASLININAYHQPGVEAGKKAASEVLALQKRILSALNEFKTAASVEDIAGKAGTPSDAETVFKILRHLAANNRVKVQPGETVFDDRYSV